MNVSALKSLILRLLSIVQSDFSCYLGIMEYKFNRTETESTPALAVDSKQQPLFHWIAINGASCALAGYPLPVPTVKPTPELLIGFPSHEEAVQAQIFLLTAPDNRLPPQLQEWRLRALLPESDIKIVMPEHPERPTTGATHWFVGGKAI
jgi:hypothetical protein